MSTLIKQLVLLQPHNWASQLQCSCWWWVQIDPAALPAAGTVHGALPCQCFDLGNAVPAALHRRKRRVERSQEWAAPRTSGSWPACWRACFLSLPRRMLGVSDYPAHCCLSPVCAHAASTPPARTPHRASCRASRASLTTHMGCSSFDAPAFAGSYHW